jgi:DNA-directed RNA polymerase specialized sigma24 family protein
LREKYFEGRTTAEIAAAHNIGEKAAESRLLRARKALKEKLLHQLKGESL